MEGDGWCAGQQQEASWGWVDSCGGAHEHPSQSPWNYWSGHSWTADSADTDCFEEEEDDTGAECSSGEELMLALGLKFETILGKLDSMQRQLAWGPSFHLPRVHRASPMQRQWQAAPLHDSMQWQAA